MQLQPHQSGARDRMRAPPNPVFAKNILQPLFDLNAGLYFHPLIDAHRAWLIMLAERNIVPHDHAAQILRALNALENDGPDSVRPFDPAAEFYYLHMERALIARVPGGESIVGNLNLGRTRPEPLARMVLRDAILRILNHVLDLRRTLLDHAAKETETVMPGYTHLLHAQPTTLAHYLLAIHDHLARDTARLLAAYDTVDQCTLGCGAMSGTSLPIDRNRVRELLGFSKLCENTLDSVAASDHVTETASAIATLMTLLGRLAQDLYIFSSQEFNLIEIPDAFSSPSSLMPQKKNALVLEYLRSCTARTIGQLTATFTTLHNVGYMDTEEVEIESIRPLYDAIAMAEESLPTMTALIAQMQPNRDLMQKRTAAGFSSVTALAELIQTQSKMSYRTAHRIVARAVLLAVEQSKDATEIDSALLNQAAQEMIAAPVHLTDDQIRDCLNPTSFVHHHTTPGGPASQETQRMIQLRDQSHRADQRATQSHATEIAEARRRLLNSAHNLIGA